MVWKEGKYGFRTGGTVRSSFAPETRSTRREGLLRHSTVRSSTEGNQEIDELVTYSLGKQNRWLLPEVIKTNHVASESEVVLVERYSLEGSKKNRRPDCFSVSQSSTTRKPKRKFTHTNDLLKDAEQVKSRYEVAYPQPAGPWLNKRAAGSRKKVVPRLGQKKNNYLLRWELEQDFDETEDTYSEEEEDVSEQCFEPYFGEVSKPLEKSKHTEKSSFEHLKKLKGKKSKKNQPRKGKCLNVKTDAEMDSTRLLAQANIGVADGWDEDSFYLNISYDIDWGQDDPALGDWGDVIPSSSTASSYEVGNQDGDTSLLNAASSYEVENQDEDVSLLNTASSYEVENEGGDISLLNPASSYELENQDGDISLSRTASSLKTSCTSIPIVPCSDESEFASVYLHCREITPTALKEKWGNMYREGAGLPRAFVLEITQLTAPFSEDAYFIVFKLIEDYSRCAAMKIRSLVSVVCSDEHFDKNIMLEFISKLAVKSMDQENWSLVDIVNTFLTRFESDGACINYNQENFTELTKPKQTFDILDRLFGWKAETFTVKGAQKEIKKSLLAHVTSIQTDQATSKDEQHSCCGICFEQFWSKDSDVTSHNTSLSACGHKFCNECWKAHLKTQIYHGQTALMCPGHECNTLVDDVTLMSLLPLWYGGHVTKKLDTLMEISPEWKWCPADQCKLVAKAITSHCSPAVHEQPAGGNTQPVMCVCGNMWCFKCQEDAHWPATCDEALVFRQSNEGYAWFIDLSKGQRINSVSVKKCPFCQYPIQKNGGCQHMECGMCHQEFCWICLGKWEEHNNEQCKSVKYQKVNLPVRLSNKPVWSYEHIAVTSHIARSSTLKCNIIKTLDKFENGLKIYAKLPLLKEERESLSCVPRLLNGLSRKNATQLLREAISFKFQALVFLEGAAITLSFSKGTASSKKFSLEFEKLLFIVERMDVILKKFSNCCTKDNLQRLEHFVLCGKKCIRALGRNRNNFSRKK